MGKDQELIDAARSGNLPALEKILTQRIKKIGPLSSLRRGKDANIQDGSGYSPLHHAALNNQKDAVQCLLEHEASTNMVDLQGSSPLHLAAWTGNTEIVKLLLTHGPSVPCVNLRNKNNETALHCAAQYGHKPVVSLLLKHNCDSTVRNLREETALDLAAQYGRLDTVQLLLKYQTDLIQPYSRDYGRILIFPHTPLHLASRNGHTSVVKELLKAGVDVNVRTSQGTALHEAALCGKVDVVRTLLDHGIDVKLQDNRKQVVLDILQDVKTAVTEEIKNMIESQPQFESSNKHGLRKTNILNPTEHHPSDIRYTNLPRRIVTQDSPEDYGKDNIYDQPSNCTEEIYSKCGNGTSHSENHSPKESKSLRHPSENNLRRKSSGASSVSPARDQYLPVPDMESQYNRVDDGTSSPNQDLYIQMSGTLRDSGPALPPRKPPRRSVSVSPTHQTVEDYFNQPNKYEFLYLARSGEKSQYVDMKLRNSGFYENYYHGHSSRHKDESSKGKRIYNDNGYRKAKSYESDYENYESIFTARNSEIYGTGTKIKSRAKHKHRRGASYSEPRHVICDDCDNGPPSPTHYDQPPTPDHPPPSPVQAEKSIYERIMPLTFDPKRVSKDIETETDNMSERADTCSLSSCISLSDNSSSENFEDICAEFLTGMGQMSISNTNEFHSTEVGLWLKDLGLGEHEKKFLDYGFDSLQIVGLLLTREDLDDLGVLNSEVQNKILQASEVLLQSLDNSKRKRLPDNVEEWLHSIDLDCYIDAFKKHMYIDMEKISRILDDELVTVLEITKLGHRKRILWSLDRLTHKLNGAINTINYTNGTTTIQRKHKKPRPPPPPRRRDDEVALPLRLPAALTSGLASTLNTQWKHLPEILLMKSVHYLTMYVGAAKTSDTNMAVSTRKCIESLRDSGTPEREVMISISRKAVFILETKTKELLGKHNIAEIHCACQDSDDLCYFAYIAKDEDFKEYTCHIFHATTMDHATEITLTLGQAFEVAYQLVLSEQRRQLKNKIIGHSRSQSANPTFLKKCVTSNHIRSQSTNEMPVIPSITISRGARVQDQQTDLRENMADSVTLPDISQSILRAPLAQDEVV